jgi:hypothetical protein
MHLGAARAATQGGDAYDLSGVQGELKVSSVLIQGYGKNGKESNHDNEQILCLRDYATPGCIGHLRQYRNRH